MKTAKEYRQIAQKQLLKNYGATIYISILFSALIIISLFIPFGPVLFGSALGIGMTTFYLTIARTGKANIKHLFGFFNGNIANVFVMSISAGLFLTFWSLIPIVGPIFAIIKSYSYSMAPYILLDNPEMNGCDAITESRKLIYGKKANLFCLDLSYFGWGILCVLTLGILSIWVKPRMAVARAAFYESLKNEKAIPEAAELSAPRTPDKVIEVLVKHEVVESTASANKTSIEVTNTELSEIVEEAIEPEIAEIVEEAIDKPTTEA